MDYRTEIILKELMKQNEPQTGKALADKMGITSRTVRDDIKGINDELTDFGAEIRALRGIGYELVIEDPKLFRSYLNQLTIGSQNQAAVPTTPEDRIAYMIKRFLLLENHLKLDDLADEMLVSKSTLQMDLKQVKRYLSRYSLELASRPGYGLTLSGSELNRRFAMSQYLFDREKLSPDLLWLDQLASVTGLTQEKLGVVWGDPYRTAPD
ncbi:MAG: helix-turn-helix domain-containing protein [Alkalibacterium sp.]|nr:helix-turn-helix domain-containing protein [Alkalibacterium sp.]